MKMVIKIEENMTLINKVVKCLITKIKPKKSKNWENN
jgi:hypothetical protein